MENRKNLYYNRTDVSERNDVNKTSESKECDICHYCYFLGKELNFQPHVCNGFHELLIMSLNLNNIAILKVKNSDCPCIVSIISKSEAINLMQNIDLTEKSGIL